MRPNEAVRHLAINLNLKKLFYLIIYFNLYKRILNENFLYLRECSIELSIAISSNMRALTLFADDSLK